MHLENLCKSVADKYRLPAEITRKLLEISLSESLTEAFGRRVIALFTKCGLQIYRECGEEEKLERLPLPLLGKELVQKCLFRVEIALQSRKALLDQGYLNTLRGSVLRGVIDKVLDDGSLSILFYLDELFNCREIAGTCPFSQQPPRERGHYRPGDPLFFFVSRVHLVGREDVVKVDVRLSRTSMRLPELLLRMKSGMGEIWCVKRIAGRLSILTARQRVPGEAISAVARELGERIRVRWGSSAGTKP